MNYVSPPELNVGHDKAMTDAYVRLRVRRHILEDLLLGTTGDLDDSASLIVSGIIDSTGMLELVMFLEESFAISIADEDLVPANLDSVDGIAALVERKLAGK
jgi:acyl carrier protein